MSRAHHPISILLMFLASAPALAQFVPQTLNYQGRLTDNTPQQNPMSGAMTMEFSIWDQPAGGNALWSGGPTLVFVTNGIFDVILGDNGMPLNPWIFYGGSERYVEIVVEGELLTPRQVLTSTAYSNVANVSADSDALLGVPASGWQRRVSGSCPAGSSIAQIGADGSVTCETDDTGVTVESDPKVAMITPNRVARWNGTALIDGLLADDGTSLSVDQNVAGAALWARNPSTTSFSSALSGRGGWTGVYAEGLAGGFALYAKGEVHVEGALSISSQTRYRSLNPGAFVPGANLTVLNYNITAHHALAVSYGPTLLAVLTANLDLPDGALLTAVDVFVEDSDAVSDLTVTVVRKSHDLSSTTLCSASTSGTGTQTVHCPTSGPIDNFNSSCGLQLDWSVDGSGVARFKVFGARLTYTITNPVP